MNTHIIGGGIIGLTIALNLCQRGETVTLHEAETPFGGASLGNAGHIATEYNYPVASLATLRKLPAMLINPLGPLRIDWRYLPKMLPWGWHQATTRPRRRRMRTSSAVAGIKEPPPARMLRRWFFYPGRFMGYPICIPYGFVFFFRRRKGFFLRVVAWNTNGDPLYIHIERSSVCITILLKPHTALRRLAVQPRTAFGGARGYRLALQSSSRYSSS